MHLLLDDLINLHLMTHNIKIALIFIVFSGSVYGQKPFKDEVFWSIWHPIAAIKVKKLYSKAYKIYNQPNTKMALDSYNNGGKLDAFRHVYFMAVMSQKIKVRKLRKLGIAHEKGNYHQFKKHQNEEGEKPDSLGNVMDLNNNELGLKIGSENKNISLMDLKELVVTEIKNGKAQIMKRKKSGIYFDCNGNIIDLKVYLNKWYIPKCLVASDYNYID